MTPGKPTPTYVPKARAERSLRSSTIFKGALNETIVFFDVKIIKSAAELPPLQAADRRAGGCPRQRSPRQCGGKPEQLGRSNEISPGLFAAFSPGHTAVFVATASGFPRDYRAQRMSSTSHV